MACKTITFRPTKENEEYLSGVWKKSEEINLAIEYYRDRINHGTTEKVLVEKPVEAKVDIKQLHDTIINKVMSKEVDPVSHKQYLKNLNKYNEIMSSRGQIMEVDEYGQTEYHSKTEALRRAGLEDFVPNE